MAAPLSPSASAATSRARSRKARTTASRRRSRRQTTYSSISTSAPAIGSRTSRPSPVNSAAEVKPMPSPAATASTTASRL